MIRDRIVRVARANLDAQTADTFAAMLMPGTRLRATPGAETGWLGGLPLLPHGLAWPSWDGHGPLAHIATLDCAQLRPALPPSLCDAGFPASGLLSFFYFDGSADGGVEVVGALFPGTADGARIIYSPAGNATEAIAPAGVLPYPRVAVTAEPMLTWPTWEHPRLYAGGGPAVGWDQIFDVLDQVKQEQRAGPAHQVGGHPDPVQGPVESEVGTGDWLLLGQFDSDSQAGFMWGDCGTLYYLIRPADLAAARFDQVAFTWQCS